MAVKAPPPPPEPAFWNWAGLYIGAHVGGALSLANFADPFGAPIYGDQVRSPGFLGGGQIGYNWQAPGSRWVFGIEADASLMDSDGTNTCFAISSGTLAANCRVRPDATATLTGRAGYAFDPAGRTLVYGKAGLAWAEDKVDMALNASSLPTFPPFVAFFPYAVTNSQTVPLWGGTVGVGVERALTPAWTVKAEYDYARVGNNNVANLGNVDISTSGFFVGEHTPSTSSLWQSFHELKVGLNYKWGADPWAPGWNSGSIGYPVKAATRWPDAGWEFEGGVRYFDSWGRFQKDFNWNLPGISSLTNGSRLTYDDLQTDSGELFGRIETPWNLFVKGYLGGGATIDGHMNDEDFPLNVGLAEGVYSNTLSPAVTGEIKYGAIDAGYDFLRGAGYKVGAFAGYFHLSQEMNAFGCTAIAFINCTPNPVPTSGSPVITETDRWDAVRIGVAAETMLTDRVKVSGEAAYLPWVWMSSLDQHFVGNTGVLAEIFTAAGKGSGVQLEAMASYYLTPQWSVGLGGRYWGMWTSIASTLNCPVGCGVYPTSFFKAQVEQLGAFVQMSYKFDWGGSVAALR